MNCFVPCCEKAQDNSLHFLCFLVFKSSPFEAWPAFTPELISSLPFLCLLSPPGIPASHSRTRKDREDPHMAAVRSASYRSLPYSGEVGGVYDRGIEGEVRKKRHALKTKAQWSRRMQRLRKGIVPTGERWNSYQPQKCLILHQPLLLSTDSPYSRVDGECIHRKMTR